MAINYNLLKKTEASLKKIFIDYLKLAINMHKKFVNFLESVKDKNQNKISKLFKEIGEIEKLSDKQQVDTYEELIWDLSKDQPMLSHLRWFVTTINSLNDIERICDYIYLMADSFMTNSDIPMEVIDISLEINNLLTPFLNEFVSKIELKNIRNYYSLFENKKITYKKDCDLLINKMATVMEKQKYYDIKSIIKFSFELHSYYRIVERLENILENTIFVTDTDFFRNKLKNEEMF